MALTTNIVGYWKLDGNSTDATGNGLNGSDTAITYSNANGIINNGAGFNGTSSEIAVANNAVLSPATMTLSFWVKPVALPTSGNTMAMIDKRDDTGGTSGWLAQLFNNSGTQLINWQGDTNTGTPGSWTATLSIIAFNHLVIVHSGTSATLYINSVSQGASGNYSITNFIKSMYFGSRGGNSFAAQAIDEVGIWSRALSSAEVSQLYNGGVGFQYPFIAPTGLATKFLLMGTGK